MVDKGASRNEILEKTGNVLGCAGASLTVNEGEISVLMGLSGSGKSTLLRAVNRLNIVSRGQVLVREGDKMVDVVSCDEATLRRLRQKNVAMVFQQFGLLPWRTVEENVGLGLELAGMPEAERKERVARQLKLVNLDQWAKKYAHELSGGMQQRVGLARAFATEAPILLMDEPFSALDPLIRTKLQDELLQLQATLKKTIIFVSHDLEEALKIGSHITIMEGGRIVQTGAPEDIVLQARQRLRPRLHRQCEPAVGADRLERHARPPRPRIRRRRLGLARPPQDDALQDRRERAGRRRRARRQAGRLGLLRRGRKAAGRRPARVLGAAGHLAEDRHARHAPLADLAGRAVRRPVAVRRRDRHQGCAERGVAAVGSRARRRSAPASARSRSSSFGPTMRASRCCSRKLAWQRARSERPDGSQ